MYDKKQHPIFCEPYCRLPPFPAAACVLNPNEWVEEHLACYFETHSMLSGIAGRLLRIPHKPLAKMKEIDVHLLDVYTLYIHLSNDR